ncbi:MAG TPA: glutamate-cysteine ligase family protein [Candidatus Limnocylindria bacterium]|nr:glutamate-cysteine ligase family protein [Candidatus Limnocylindria bacterium]
MKPKQVEAEFEGARRREFIRALLRDLRALDRMVAEDRFEEGVRRVGAEQELFLIDRAYHPAPVAMQLLERLNDPQFTTELGAFQLELNLEPLPMTGDCLSRMHRRLEELLGKLRTAAAELGYETVLTGILPTLRQSDLGLENMVPNPRYHALNRAMSELRGEAYEIFIKGLDELRLKHESVMTEACNSSFQVHLQVGAREFANLYNLAQALAGPVLACATNSPLLFGRRLWSETRIALFQQAVDTRSPQHERSSPPRVTFGDGWVKRSVVELYREDIARFRTLVGIQFDEEPDAQLDRGLAPELKSLRLHNGTVYRWNRACYGITNGKAHLRIENRVFPSGPSVADQIANGAFWYGLMISLAAKVEDITQRIEFEQAKTNFVSAAREGLGAHLVWLDGELLPAPQLVLDRLLPLADEGLSAVGIDAADRSRYLGIVEQRARTGRTGSRWLIHSLTGMKGRGTPAERLNALTAATVARQREGRPVSEWEPAQLEEAGGWKHNYLKVEQYMTTDVYTVHAEDPVALAAHLMEWQRIRHVPVEDHQHRLVGLLSYRALLRLLSNGKPGSDPAMVPVSEVMNRDPVVVAPDMPTRRAVEIMRERGVGCLLVVSRGRLIGIVTEHDFMEIASQLLEEKLGE